MKVSSAWIRKCLGRTILTDQQVADALDRAGLEVEQVILSKPIDKKVVVALVKKVIQHPGADRLHLVFVTTGTQDFRIVCGASNVREGMKSALAQIGVVLPGGDKISAAKLRGEVSEGMLCSEFELGIGKNHDGIVELPDDAEVGRPVGELYPADAVIDLSTPANRWDVLSVRGLAREVAAMTDARLEPEQQGAELKFGSAPAVEAGAESGRYVLARMELSQKSGKTPKEMEHRLIAAGMRPVSPVVDVTNYVMLETGQPLHAFDADKVKLPLTVRRARKGEVLETLDGVKRQLDPEDIVIADSSGPIGLAGVMGGIGTEVGPGTRMILLEAATFDAVAVRKTAKRHGLRTEASARFERGLPVELAGRGLARAVEVMAQVTGAGLVEASDQQNEKPGSLAIALTMERLERVLGFGISTKEAVGALSKLGIEVSKSSKNQIEVGQIPWWRGDLTLPEDLAEEVVRVMGYERVPSALPPWRPQQVAFDRERAKLRLTRDVMYGSGLFEVQTYSFVSDEQLTGLSLNPAAHAKLKNPLTVEQAYLRSSMLPSHLAVLARNRHYARDVGFYEISTVFAHQGGGKLPRESQQLAITLNRPEEAFAHLKGILDALALEMGFEIEVRPEDAEQFAPGRAGAVLLQDNKVGIIGQLHPGLTGRLKVGGEIAYLELELKQLLSQAVPRKFTGLPKFPVITRDLSVILPQAVTWQAVRQAAAPDAISYVDEYRGPGIGQGNRALTVRMVVERSDRTPTETEATAAEAKLLRRLERAVGAQPRT